MIFILFLWCILIFYGISKNKTFSKPFDRNQTLALRGICAVEIMIGHLGLETGSIALYPNRKAGILFVGIFFLLSGYGVAYSVEHKKDYLKHFLSNRALKLLLPAYIVKITMFAAESFLSNSGGGGIDLKDFLTDFNWYVWEQLLFYFVYWLACKLLPAYVELSVGIFSVLFISLAYIIGMDNPWYGSSLCFALGLYYYQYEKKRCAQASVDIKGMVFYGRINDYLLLVSMLAVTGISIILFFVLGNDSILGNPIARNTASVSFGIAIIILLYRWRIGNKVSRLLGEFSYEIFLVHPYMLAVLSAVLVKSKVFYGVLTVVLSILSAYLIHLLIGWIFKICYSLFTNKKK